MLNLFGEEQVPPAAIQRLPVRERRLASGMHPLSGKRLSDTPGARCGNCAHLRRLRYHGATYQKCRLGPVSHGTATDVRMKWPGCCDWQEVKG